MKKGYKILSLLLCGCMVFASTSAAVYAEEQNSECTSTDACEGIYENGICSVCGGYQAAVYTDGKYDLNEDGTIDSAYEISNAGQLMWFAQLVNGIVTNDATEDLMENAILLDDIVVNENVLVEDEEGNLILNPDEEVVEGFIKWTPIGADTLYDNFFEGNGKTVSGLYLDEIPYNYVGMFGQSYPTSYIGNLTVTDSYLSGRISVGGVIGWNEGIVDNCESRRIVAGERSGTLTEEEIAEGYVEHCYVGGIAGINRSRAVINCRNSDVVASAAKTYTLGGIVGSNEGLIGGCSNSGALQGNSVYIGDGVGGIAGRNEAIITECSNSGTIFGNRPTGGIVGDTFMGEISDCTNEGLIQGEGSAGGISGAQNQDTQIMNCSNTGTISGSSAVGGITGAGSAELFYCENFGTITGDSSVGGIAGSAFQVENCTNYAAVTGSGEWIGGIIGNMNSCEVVNCMNSGNVTGDKKVGGIAGNSIFEVIRNCCNIGAVRGESYVGGIIGYNDSMLSEEITNCYYLAECALRDDGVIGWGIGNQIEEVEGMETKSMFQFASGEVAYLLNGSTSEGELVWYQNLDNGMTKDDFPVLDSEHGIVYTGYKDYCVRSYSNDNTGLSDTMLENATHIIDISTGQCAGCGETVCENVATVIVVNEEAESGYIYNGSAQTPEVSVTMNGVTLARDIDYTVSYRDNINVGTATVIVSGIGNYFGDVSTTFEIGKTILTVSAVTAESKVYDKETKVNISSVELSGYKGDDDATTVYLYLPELYGVLEGIDAGTYTQLTLEGYFILTGIDGAYDNYELVQPEGFVPITGSVIVEKAELADLPAVNVESYYATEDISVDLIVDGMPEDAGVLQYVVGASDAVVSGSAQITSWNVDEAGRLTAVISNGSAGDTLTFPVTIKSTNYKDITMNVIVNLVDKTQVTITGLESVGEVTYDGTEKAGFTGTPANEQGYSGTYEMSYAGTLKDGSAYAVTDKAPTQAGDYTVTIKIPDTDSTFMGSVALDFSIAPASLIVVLKDKVMRATDSLPTEYAYELTGVIGEDSVTVEGLDYGLKEEPTYDSITNRFAPGVYIIIAEGGTVTNNNYCISEYVTGILTVTSSSYTVTFDVQGIGTAPAVMSVEAGSLVTMPEAPEKAGYIFNGWYQDVQCTKAWNFDTNIVQGDMTLYACWSEDIEKVNFNVQEITDVSYTGSALKPSIKVYDSETGTLLKAGTHYTVKYYNNTKVNASDKIGGIGYKENSSVSNENIHNISTDAFSFELPYVVITGKGNYSGILYVNFNILPVSISDVSGNLAKGFILKSTDQLTASTKNTAKPFTSLKYKKAMKAGTDYTVTLKTLKAYDAEGALLETGTVVNASAAQIPTIPKGYTGTFEMTITGIRNFKGTITKTVYVQSKTSMLKNAVITLGASQKARPYEEGNAVTLTPAVAVKEGKKTIYYAVENGQVTENVLNAKEVFTVKAGSTYLIYGKDYTVSYTNNTSVGTATMTITGMGDYVGSKSVTFKITGVALNKKNVAITGVADKDYTGKAITQNDAKLIYKKKVSAGVTEDVELVCGKDYTISYKNNIKKGTATMTFTMLASSGYTGKLTKTFKINAVSLASEKVTLAIVGMDNQGNITASHSKAGAKPAVSFIYNGMTLKEGTDYTVSYANNTTVTKATTKKMPTITIKGEGNYSGTLKKEFTITASDLQGAYKAGELTVTTASTIFNVTKAASYEYQPKVTIKAGNKTLKAGVDYKVTGYGNNTQEALAVYFEKLSKGESTEGFAPYVTIGAGTGGNYVGADIKVDLHIYKEKLSSSTIYVVVDEAVYTGKQLTPETTVYYGSKAQINAVKKAVKEGVALEKAVSENGLIELIEGTDYTLNYGKNITVGKNKGSVTIKGINLCGGSASVKFTIQKKAIYNVNK